jgi:hypothetical protein
LGHFVFAIGLIVALVPFSWWFWPELFAHSGFSDRYFPPEIPFFVLLLPAFFYFAAYLADKKDRALRSNNRMPLWIWAFLPLWVALIYFVTFWIVAFVSWYLKTSI